MGSPFTLTLCDGDIESLMSIDSGTRKEKAALHDTAFSAWQYMGDNRNVSYPLRWSFTNHPDAFGDYVHVGACALCSVVTVIIRQLCQKKKGRKSKLHQYESAGTGSGGTSVMSHQHGVMGIAGGNNLRPPRRGKHVQWASTESHSGGTSGDASPLKTQQAAANGVNANGYGRVGGSSYNQKHIRNGTNYPRSTGGGASGGGRSGYGGKKYQRPAPGLIDDGHGAKTVPLKERDGIGSTQFSTRLSGIANANDVMMDDVIDAISGSRKKKGGYLQHQNVDTEFHEGSPSESTDDETNSDDTMMEKPQRHKYSNHHQQHGQRYRDDDEKLVRPPTAERAERRRKKRKKERERERVKGRGRGGSRMQRDAVDEAEEESVDETTTTGDYPYHDITNSEFGKLQKAITNAKTKSDFEKLESIIKHGQIPPDNWHGKGTEYERLRSEHMESLQEQLSKQSSLYKMSDGGSTADSSQYNGLPQMANHDPQQKKPRGQKLVQLDESELTDKLKKLRNGRKSGREPGGMQRIYVSEYQ